MTRPLSSRVLNVVRRLVATKAGEADTSDDATAQEAQLAPPDLKKDGNTSELGQALIPEWPKLTIDHAWRVGDLGCFLIGWCLDPAREIGSVYTEAPDGSRVPLSGSWARVDRQDVVNAYPNHSAPHDPAGFIALVRGAGLSGQLNAIIELKMGSCMRVSAQVRPVESFRWFVRALHESYPMNHPQLGRIIADHVGPALEAAYTKETIPECEVLEERFGLLPAKPVVSVIVPLYGRADFMRYQLALLSGDPDLSSAEIIYVVDDPRIHETAIEIASGMCELLSTPVRIVTCGRNLGYAGANNLGARVANGQFLLFVNSDVLPTRPGWIGHLAAAFDSLPDAGVVGTELRYEDGSVQFAGMRSVPHDRWGGALINVHPRKGQSPDLVNLQVPAVSESVTGAVLAMRKADFYEVGGMDEAFHYGDFEDSALCALVKKRGQRCFVLPWLGLYHLERLSQGLIGDANFRAKVTMVNAWRFTTHYASHHGQLVS